MSDRCHTGVGAAKYRFGGSVCLPNAIETLRIRNMASATMMDTESPLEGILSRHMIKKVCTAIVFRPE